MDKQEFLTFITNFLQSFMDKSDLILSLETKLETIPDWTSMALVATMASIQSEYQREPDLDKLYSAKSINDIYEAFC